MTKPVENYKEVIKTLMRRGRFIGFNMLDDGYSFFNIRIMPIVFNIISFLFIISYNLKINADDIERFVFCLVTFALLIKSLSKMAILFGDIKALKAIIAKAEKFYEKSEKYDCEEIFYENARYIKILMNSMSVLYTVAGISSMLNPFLLKLIGKELMLPFGFQLPFIEPFTTYGYFWNYLYSLLCAINCVSGFSVGDILFALTVTPAFGAYQMLIKMLDDLDKFDNDDNEDSIKMREEKYQEIIQTHQELYEFLNDLEKFYKVCNCINLGVNILQAVASLFALIIIRWYIGISFVVINIFEAFMFCSFGEILGSLQDEFYEKIYEVKWVERKQNERKRILFMLTATRKIKELSYIFGPLNFITYSSVNKTQIL